MGYIFSFKVGNSHIIYAFANECEQIFSFVNIDSNELSQSWYFYKQLEFWVYPRKLVWNVNRNNILGDSLNCLKGVFLSWGIVIKSKVIENVKFLPILSLARLDLAFFLAG